MRFYTIDTAHGSNAASNTLLRAACEQRGVEYSEVIVDQFDFLHAPQLGRGDALYVVSAHESASILMRHILHPDVVTFYRSYETALKSRIRTETACQQYGVPMPKTLPLVSYDPDRIADYAAYLGGFPIILKVLGGSHGVGVMKADSLPSLLSIAEYVIKLGLPVIMREFIYATSHARCIVLGNAVIDSIEYSAQHGDFRTNTGAQPVVRPMQFSEEVQKIAIDIVHASQIEFGGVDIIIDTDGRPYVLEANFPCYFPRAQHITGVDIAGKMIDYLMAKAQQQR